MVIPAAIGAAFLVVPLVGLVAQAPWGRLPILLLTEATRSALWLSLWTSTAAAALCILVGTPLGWGFARAAIPGRRVLRGLVLTPLVLPPVVAGVALLSAFGRSGIIGAPLRTAFGVSIPYTSLAVVLAHAFVAMPFFVLSAEAAFRALPDRLEAQADSLGASPWRVFASVTLPLAAPGLLAATVLAWARSLGEFGATITFAGNYPGTTRTLPLEVYTQLQADPAAATAVSLVLFAVCLGVLIGLRERWWGALR